MKQILLTTVLGAVLVASASGAASHAGDPTHPDDCKIPVKCTCIRLGGVIIIRNPSCIVHWGGGTR